MHEFGNEEGLGPRALTGVNLSFRREGRRKKRKDTQRCGGSKKRL